MNWTGSIEAHYQKIWRATPATCLFHRGPLHELPPEFKVLAFPPHPGREIWTYATCGMSLPSDANPLELHLLSPHPSDGLVELLFVIAHFHRTGAKLNLGHTVNFGRPWLAFSECSFGLVSRPYLDGPELENLEFQGKKVRYCWLIPITPAEREFKKAQGVDALEARFEASGVDYSNPARASVV